MVQEGTPYLSGGAGANVIPHTVISGQNNGHSQDSVSRQGQAIAPNFDDKGMHNGVPGVTRLPLVKSSKGDAMNHAQGVRGDKARNNGANGAIGSNNNAIGAIGSNNNAIGAIGSSHSSRVGKPFGGTDTQMFNSFDDGDEHGRKRCCVCS